MSMDHSNVCVPSVPNNSNGNSSKMREGEVEDEQSSANLASAAKSAFEITSVSTTSSDDLESIVRQPTSADTNGGVDPLKRKASGESQDNIGISEDVKVEGATGNIKPALGGLALHLQAKIQGIAEGKNPSVQQGASRFKRLNNYDRGRWAVRDTSTPTDSPTRPNVPALDSSEPVTHLPPPSTIPSQPATAASIPIAVSSAQENGQNYTYAPSSKRSHMTTAGTDSAEYRTIQEKRSQLVTKIAERARVRWLSENLQKNNFITPKQALGITSDLRVSAEGKVSSLLEAVESKIQLDQRGTQFSNFAKMLEGEVCLQDLGQTLQYECQMIKQQYGEMISGQIAMSGSDAKPSLSTRYNSIDPRSSMTGGVPHSPKRFLVEDVDESSNVYGSRGSLPEEDENNTNMVEGELPTLRSTAHQQVDVFAPSSMAQTSTLTRTKDLQDYVSAEPSDDVTKKDSQIKNLKEQLKKHLQLQQRVEEQEKQITALTEKNEKLETEVQEKTEELTRTTNQLEESEQNLSLEKQTVQQLKQQIKSTREQLANKEKAFEKMRRDKEKEIAELCKALEEKAKEVEAHEELVTGLRAERDNLKLKLSEKQNELLEAKLALAQKGEMLANTKTELIQLQSEKKLEEERRSNEKKLEEERRNSKKELEEERKNSAATFALQKAELDKLREKFSKMQHSDSDTTP